MSVVPMKLLTIAGPLERFDDVVRACVIDQEFHPENALQLMRSVKGLRPLELENPYSALLHRSVEVADEAGIPLAYAPFDPASPLEDFASYFDSLSGRIAALHRRREELEHKADEARSMVDQLQNLRGLNVSLDELWGLDHARFPNLSCVADTADDVRHAKPPTKLKNSFLGRVFQPFLEMYGLPAYNEKDPSLFMALTYCLFFGIMFGDLGQGLCLALIGLVLARWKGMWLGGIITCCGLSGALFGCVYGSVFGFEDILPGFKIMEETTFAGLGMVSNVLLLLVLSICLGVFMLLLVMVINILNGIRQKNYEKILFGPNGAAGIVFYAGLLTAAVSTLAFGVNLFTPAYVLPVLILPLVLMLLREPLSHLLAKDPHWREFSVGEVLGTGFFELFETLLSYLTNTLSFMRVGAYAITHVGLMLVVHMLAGLAGGVGGPAGILILVLGNAFVMGFEGLLVGIQVLRLEFYELFGRFYDDGGIPFVPKKIDYAARTNG